MVPLAVQAPNRSVDWEGEREQEKGWVDKGKDRLVKEERERQEEIKKKRKEEVDLWAESL